MSSNTFQPRNGTFYLLEFGDLVSSGRNASLRCRLRVKDDSMEDNAVIEMTPLTRGDDAGLRAQWSFEEVEPGWFTIINRNSGKVIDLDGYSQSEGERFKQNSRHPPTDPNRY